MALLKTKFGEDLFEIFFYEAAMKQWQNIKRKAGFVNEQLVSKLGPKFAATKLISNFGIRF